MKEGTLNGRTKAAESMCIELVYVQALCEESVGPDEEVSRHTVTDINVPPCVLGHPPCWDERGVL
jgi:hypothetical protein